MIYIVIKGSRDEAEKACFNNRVGFCYIDQTRGQATGYAPDEDRQKIVDWFNRGQASAPYPVGELLWYSERTSPERMPDSALRRQIYDSIWVAKADDITPFPANRPEDGAFAKRELPAMPHDPADMQGLPIMPINQAGYPSDIWHVHIGTGDVTLRVDNDDPRKLYVETNYDGVESLDLAEASHMLAVLANIVDWMRQQPEPRDPLDEPDGWALLPVEDQLAHINGVVRRDRDVLKRQWVLDWMFAHWNLVTIEVTR